MLSSLSSRFRVFSTIGSILGLIAFALLSRFLPHPPNCTAIQAVALFAMPVLNSLPLAYLTLFTTMFISDIFLGLHSTLFFVYLSLGIVTWMGSHFSVTYSLRRTLFSLVTSSFVFFFITNFGVWLLTPFYPKTMGGLGGCYLAALPFLSNQILGNLLYGSLLFGIALFINSSKRGTVKASSPCAGQ